MAGKRQSRKPNRPNPQQRPGVPTRRPHMEFGQRGQDTGMGNRQQPGGKVPGGLPNKNIFPGAGNFGQGGQGWMGPGNMQFGNKPKSGGGGRPQDRNPNKPGQGWGQGGRRRSTGMPEQSVPGFDYDAFNAWQDPTISGQQPGPIQQGWGGFGASNDTMLKTKMNNYLNQQSVGGDRETMMNQIGYFNGGNPYTPQVPRGTNQFYRANANSGQYTSPGIYQHQSLGAGQAANDYAYNGGDLNFGGYTGYTTVGEDGSGQYTPFDVNANQGGRRRSTRIGGNIY